MFRRVPDFFARHPLVCQVLLWSVPALVVGAVLRLLLLSYSPFAYWGADSPSFFSFTYQLLTTGDVSLNEKRRYLYPLFLLPISLLPGAPLRWVAWVQHALGLAAVIPLAGVVRLSLRHWQWVVVPVTLAYATMPLILWYEHEVLAEHLFFTGLVLAMAGWCGWAGSLDNERPALPAAFWFFFAGLAVVVLTKPAGRFLWPGLFAGLAMSGAWRALSRRQWFALAALLAASLTMGQKSQTAHLLYTTAFPLTRLDTPLHAEFKSEIADEVARLRKCIWEYHAFEDKNFLQNPWRHPQRPTWHQFKNNPALRDRVYRELALEGIRARPDLFLAITLQRIIASANPALFDTDRFAATYSAERMESDFHEAREKWPRLFPMLLNLPPNVAPDDYAPVARMVSPKPGSPVADRLRAFADGWQRVAELVRPPPARGEHRHDIRKYRPTLLGWFLAGAIALSLLPTYRRTLGVWTLAAFTYLAGVFLIGTAHVRYFAPAHLIFLPLLAVPLDLLLRLVTRGVKNNS